MKKIFYDILTIVYVLFIIGSFFLVNKFVNEDLDKFVQTKSLDLNKSIQATSIQKIVLGVLVFIYWIFILVLAIRLKRPVVSIVLIAIFVPFAIYYYLFSLRKLIPDNNSQV